MTVKELKEILNKMDEKLEVKYYNSYRSRINGYFVAKDEEDPVLMLTDLEVQPL